MKYQKIRNIIPYFIFAVFCAIILTKPFGSGDELWNYSFAKNIVNGKVPYRDFNIVQTPLSAYIAAAFMYIFGDGLFVHRIVGYLLLFSIISLIFYLCKKVTNSTFIGLLSALFVACETLPFYIYNYNYLSAFVILIIITIEINQEKESFAMNIAIGLFVGFLVLIKQNTGAMLMLANIVICVVNVLKYKKNKITQFTRASVSLIPIIIFMLYLLFVGAIVDFFDYAVLGISTFVHRTTPIDLIVEAPFFLSYILFALFAFAFMINKMRKEKLVSEKLSGFSFALAWLMVTYPLFDASHLSCVFLVLVPVFCMFTKQKIYKNWEKDVCVFIVMLISILSVAAFLPSKEVDSISSINCYEGIPIDSEMNKKIRIVCEYIEESRKQGYRVRVVGDSAIAFKIPIDYYEKDWDLLLVGNIGTKSVDDLLETSEKCQYLVNKNTELLGSQNHFELIEYIKNNYVKVGEVLMFDVYEKK